MSVDSLPSEILIYIFHLVIGPYFCQDEQDGRILKAARAFTYLELLSHVSSRWRRVVLTTPTFWTHIDLFPLRQQSQRLGSRALTVAKRASGLPLEFHISGSNVSQSYYRDTLLEVLGATALQIRALRLDLTPSMSDSSFPYRGTDAFDACLRSCVPGILTELALGVSWDDPALLMSADDSSDDGLHLGLPSEELDALLLPIKSLRLNGVYFAWASCAYWGLTELYLTWERQRIIIDGADLVGILTSSPQLRVFDFEIGLEELQQPTLPPAHLVELEVLDLCGVPYDEVGAIVRLVVPGPRPLRFSLEIHNNLEPIYDGNIMAFFMRSNVTRLGVKISLKGRSAPQRDLILSFDQILHPLPRLREVLLDDFNWSRYQYTTTESSLCQCNTHLDGPRLDTLYVRGLSIYLNPLRRIIQRHPINALVIWGFVRNGERMYSDSEAEIALAGICPVVSVRGDDFFLPMMDWN